MARRDEGPSGVLLLDKPAGPSSTQALAAAKRALGSRKGGHTGTLDPFATGLLPLAFGEATKFSRFLIDSRKGYLATLRLGFTSTSGDPEGSVCAVSPCSSSTTEIEAVVRGFVGVQDQVPPMHSAVHHQGRRLYELAREGLEVERAPRRVEVYSMEVVAKSDDLLQLSVICSKGTYIRTLAADIGLALGCGAYLVALRRTRSGHYRLEQGITLDDLKALGPEQAATRLLPAESLVEALPRVALPADLARRANHGMTIPLPAGVVPGEAALFDPVGRFLGVGLATADGWMAPVRLMAERMDGPVFT